MRSFVLPAVIPPVPGGCCYIQAVKEATSGLVLAPVLLRIAAFVLDVGILIVINLALSGLGVIEVKEGRPASGSSFALLMIVGAAYHIGFLAARSATPGKTAMNIYVGYRDGSAIRPDTAILRYLIVLGENFFLVGAIVGLVLMFTDRDRRTIHDRIAGTIVYAGRPGAPLRIEDDARP